MNNGSGARGVGKGGVAPPKQKSEGTYSPPAPPPPPSLPPRFAVKTDIAKWIYKWISLY